MFSLIKVSILVFMTCSSCNIIKSITGNFIKISLEIFLDKPGCFLLKNKKYKVRKVIVDND